eukprot:g12383.t1
MDLIASQDAAGFHQYLAEHANTICGRHPIATFMNAINASPLRFAVEWVDYRQSTKVTSPEESSVSYASAIITQEQVVR